MTDKCNLVFELHQKVGYPIIDHTERKKEKGKIFSYPYTSGKESFRKLIAFCDKHNLDFAVRNDDVYFPGGGTVQIIIEKNKK